MPFPGCTMQTNDIEQAVELFAEVLQVKARHYGGERFGPPPVAFPFALLQPQ